MVFEATDDEAYRYGEKCINKLKVRPFKCKILHEVPMINPFWGLFALIMCTAILASVTQPFVHLFVSISTSSPKKPSDNTVIISDKKLSILPNGKFCFGCGYGKL